MWNRKVGGSASGSLETGSEAHLRSEAFRRLLGGVGMGLLVLVVGCAGTGAAAEAGGPAPPEAPADEEPDETVVAEAQPDEELQRAERVARIRLNQEPIRVGIGEAVDFQGLEPTPVDADGEVVEDVSFLMAPLQSPVAAFEEGSIRGLEEGEAELMLAVLVPGAGGQPEPRIFNVSIVVAGAPVASVTIREPELALYQGTVIPLTAEALTEDGTPRARVEVEWRSRDPEVASVTPSGHVTGHRPGRATVLAEAEGVTGERVVEVRENPVESVELSPSGGSVRTGDVIPFEATPRDGAGNAVTDIRLTYSIAGASMRTDLGAAVYEDGAFVAERPGSYRVVASAGGVSSEVVVEARAREVRRDVTQVGLGLVSHAPTSDLWVFEGVDGRDYAYIGTHAGGQKMFAWDVTNPAAPVLTDSVVVDARVVNDVKVNEDATLAVITREGASDRRNGIVLLDLSEPAHPQVIREYTENLTGGVHNTFIVGDLVYAVHNGTLDVHIIDISDPHEPHEVGRWGIDRPGKYLHDFWVVDGIGYASYWDDGVWILDVGDGRWGGTPTEPVVISSYAYPEGHTHVAFPYTNSDGRTYLFVGDEIFGCQECISRAGPHEEGPRGFVHILDLTDPEAPVEVGRYEVPEAGVHNLWAHEDKLYAAYYQAGLRVVDISGELRGNLYGQGREIAWFPTGTPDGYTPNSPMAWGPQPFKDQVFVSDLNSGLWVLRLEPGESQPPVP